MRKIETSYKSCTQLEHYTLHRLHQVLYITKSQAFARELSYFWNWLYEKPGSHSPSSSVIQPAS